MLHTDQGWRLSPAYDIVPSIYQPGQILQVHGKHSAITADDIIREGKSCGLSHHKSTRVLQAVLQQLSTWQSIFFRCKVPELHTEKLRADIDGRFHKIGMTYR